MNQNMHQRAALHCYVGKPRKSFFIRFALRLRELAEFLEVVAHSRDRKESASRGFRAQQEAARREEVIRQWDYL